MLKAFASFQVDCGAKGANPVPDASRSSSAGPQDFSLEYPDCMQDQNVLNKLSYLGGNAHNAWLGNQRHVHVTHVHAYSLPHPLTVVLIILIVGVVIWACYRKRSSGAGKAGCDEDVRPRSMHPWIQSAPRRNCFIVIDFFPIGFIDLENNHRSISI